MSQFQRKNSFTEKTAKNADEAKEAALAELGITEDEAIIEIISEGSKGFFGLGARDAIVRVTVKESADKALDKAAKITPAAVQPDQKTERNIPQGSPSETAKAFLDSIFKAMRLEVAIDIQQGDDNTINIALSGENMGIIIGKRGDTLDSLQYLTSLVVNQGAEDYIKVSIDTENYREKRTEALIALSDRLAEKVARTGKRFTLEPMNPYERRVIHSNLQNNESVTTYSVGSEPYRKVVIAPKGAKSYRRRGGYSRKGGAHSKVKDTPSKPSQQTYKADFKPQQHKAEYKSIDEYFASQSDE